MRTSTYFGRAIKFYLIKHDMTQSELAAVTGQRQSTISDFISKPKRPDEQTLKVLCSKWPAHDTNVSLLVEHLRDEIARAGHDPERTVTMSVSGVSIPETQTERDIEVIRRHLSDDGVSELLHDISVILTRTEKAEQWGRAAENSPARDPEHPTRKTGYAAPRRAPGTKGHP